MLSERRDEEAATAFFKQAINNNGFPDKVVMDKSGANYVIFTSLKLRFQDFQRMKNALSSGITILLKL
jgi:transposase-like protein